MRNSLPYLLALATCLTAGCMVTGHRDTAARRMPEQRAASLGSPAGGAEPLPVSTEAAAPPVAGVARKVIYTGIFEIVVDNASQAVKATKTLAERLGGYMQRTRGTSIVIRVPAERFDAAVAELEQMGTITQRDVTARDVTEQYTDLKIRLSNARALLKRLQSLLDKAETVKDALALEKELARIREQIERLQGRMNSLASQVAYATLSVAFHQVANAPPELRVRLPFGWLRNLGLDSLLGFSRSWH